MVGYPYVDYDKIILMVLFIKNKEMSKKLQINADILAIVGDFCGTRYKESRWVEIYKRLSITLKTTGTRERGWRGWRVTD